MCGDSGKGARRLRLLFLKMLSSPDVLATFPGRVVAEADDDFRLRLSPATAAVP